MTSNLGGWIHIFTVTDTQKHKGGYTIYKITSVVFPRALPQALTCLTVWRRFHDVKRLHRELSRRYKTLHLPGELPVPTDASFFKRFDAKVIQRRKEYILQLLDFAAQQPALYKSHAFAQFFSDAEHNAGNGGLVSSSKAATIPHLQPLDLLLISGATNKSTGSNSAITDNGNREQVAVDINPAAAECVHPVPDKLANGNAWDALALSNGKSAPLTSSASSTKECNEANASDLREDEVNSRSANEGEQTSSPGQRVGKDYTRFLTPMASIESDDSDYIYEAALEFSRAVEAEANLAYRDAYKRYKSGVELLLNGVKDDGNEERKFIAKAKVTKYLSRADDIYDKFLHRNGSHTDNAAHPLSRGNFQLSIDVADYAANVVLPDGVYLERPWNNLAKYKVVRVLGERVMQVQCVTEAQRTTYVMKGIEKPSSNSPTQSVFLPQHVPYMVNLLAFFQSEQKIFLLLHHAEGGRLWDYIETYTPTAERVNYAGLFPDDEECIPVEDGPTAKTEFNELVRCSEQLLQSVANTLSEKRQVDNSSAAAMAAEDEQKEKCVSRRIPEASLKQWASELAVAIHSLHGKGVILRDLSMENLLLGGRGQLLLTYFYQNEGLDTSDSNHVHKGYNLQALAGHFVAPETHLTRKSDWWSYGVILYQLLTGLSFKSAHPGQIDLYGSVQYPENVEITDQGRDLLENLLQQAPEERYNYERVQRHAFFAGTNWQEVQMNGVNSNIKK